jgi:hypothetical protein
LKSYFVEGLYITPQAVQSARQRGEVSSGNFEPYARTVWALDSDDAKRIATEDLKGGEWVDGPKVLNSSEEQRMRALGAPELPGLGFSRRK